MNKLDLCDNKTKQLVEDLLSGKEINHELIHPEIINDIKKIKYRHFLDNISDLPNNVVLKHTLYKKNKILFITKFISKNYNKLLFDTFDDFEKFIDTYETKYLSKDGNYNFLHLLSVYGKNNLYYGLLKYLLNNQKDINLNELCKNGKTPLMYAVNNVNTTSSESIVLLLLEQKSLNVNVKNNDENSVFMILNNKENRNTVEEDIIIKIMEHPSFETKLNMDEKSNNYCVIS